MRVTVFCRAATTLNTGSMRKGIGPPSHTPPSGSPVRQAPGIWTGHGSVDPHCCPLFPYPKGVSLREGNVDGPHLASGSAGCQANRKKCRSPRWRRVGSRHDGQMDRLTLDESPVARTKRARDHDLDPVFFSTSNSESVNCGNPRNSTTAPRLGWVSSALKNCSGGTPRPVAIIYIGDTWIFSVMTFIPFCKVGKPPPRAADSLLFQPTTRVRRTAE